MGGSDLEPLGVSELGSPGRPGRRSEPVRQGTTRVVAFDRILARRMLGALGDPPFSIDLWNGEQIYTSRAPSVARVEVNDRRALVRLMLDPEMSFGDLYSVGRVDVGGDLVGALESVNRGLSRGDAGSSLWRFLRRMRWPHANSLRNARRNIHHHYDIGNDFYALWLDGDALQYTCAYYPRPSMSLQQAQAAKMHHVCRKLRLRPGESVVEAGCGWGGLALFMARHYGVRVRAFNISHRQVAHARECASAQGLDDRVEFVEDDYRNVHGRYDAFVSVGMLEHVGPRYYGELGRLIRRSLESNGRGLIHSIGRNVPQPMNRWIERRIFPGAYPPTLREMMAVLEPGGFSVVDVENLRLHYAKTLRHWLERFEDNRERIRRMYDEPFVRAWRLYLAGSIAAFTTGWLQLFQVVFTRPQDNDLPWSREHLYAGPSLPDRGG